MPRKWKDALGDAWTVSLIPAGAPHPDTNEPLEHPLIRFDAEERSVECFARGDFGDSVKLLRDRDLELAMEAASDGRGFLFMDPGGHPWWVRGFGDNDADGTFPLTFDDGHDEFHHAGPLSAQVEELSDDELEEILDQLRGVTA